MEAFEVLSANEREIFRAVVRVMVGDEPAEDVADSAEPFLRRMTPTDRRLIKLLLWLVEHAVPVLTGRARRFTALEPDQQREYLQQWIRSHFKIRRKGATALKALSMLAHYCRDESWAAVGYDGPWLGRVDVPVLPAADLSARPASIVAEESGPLATAGVTAGRSIRRDIHVHAQVCIIGTGAGGAAAAARLAARGIDVIAVEGGGYHQAGDFNQRELEMLPMLFAEGGLRATADKAIGILQGRGVGGSTLHNTGLVVAPPRGIIERWEAEHGLPLDRHVMKRYADEAINTLAALPIPREKINPNNEVLRQGAQAKGWKFHIPLHNRSECCGCGYCMLGCAYNRKNNATLTYLPSAVRAGARVLSDAQAERIEGPPGARRVICNLLDSNGRPGGFTATIEAPVVMLAAGALDTPALLLRSRLGNRNVGRGLRLHPSPFVAAVFPQVIEGWRGLPQSVIVDEFASFYNDGYGGHLIIALAGWPGLAGFLAPGSGPPHRAMMQRFKHVASAVVLLHDETAGTVRTGLHGQPVARYWPQKSDMGALHDGIRSLASLYLTAGAEEVRLPYVTAPPVRNHGELEAVLKRLKPAPHRLSLNSVHPQGSCPLGATRNQGACDPYGELWDYQGLFVCDTSLFPTSVGVPPQVTTMALATAVADYVVAERLKK